MAGDRTYERIYCDRDGSVMGRIFCDARGGEFSYGWELKAGWNPTPVRLLGWAAP